MVCGQSWASCYGSDLAQHDRGGGRRAIRRPAVEPIAQRLLEPGEVLRAGWLLGQEPPHERPLEQLVPMAHRAALVVEKAHGDAPRRGGGGPENGRASCRG